MSPSDAARKPKRPAAAKSRLVSRGLVPAAVLAGSLGAATPGGASTTPIVTTAKIAGLGSVLVASHRPLYEMANGHSTCTGACAQIWKPLIVSRKASHHLGHVSGLGTIHHTNKLQVAVHGHGLFFFVADHSQSHAGGQGFASKWFTVKSNGALNRTTSATVPPAPSSVPAPTSSPAPTSVSSTTTPPQPTSPQPASPPPTAPPRPSPPPTPTTAPPATTTTTAAGNSGGGGVGF